MTQRFYIHVGPHKTGTTYVQGLLAGNHDVLGTQGVLFPRRNWHAQARAVRDVVRRGSMPTTGRSVAGEWDTLLAEVREWPGPSAVISHEMLSTATAAEIRGLVRSLRGWDVHVVFTARDLTRVAPAMWQTRLRSAQPVTWTEYARALQHPEAAAGSGGQRFWLGQDAAAVLGRWGKHLPVAHLHVLTVPPSGSPPALLWQRFCTVLGIEATGHDLDPRRSNPSLGTAEAELLRRVNAALSTSGIEAQDWLRWARWLGRHLEGRAGAARFTLPPEDFSWLAERSERIVSDLRSGGYPVTGDLDDLVPRPLPADESRHPEDTTDGAVLDAAVDAIRGLVVRLAAQRSESTGED